MSPPIHAWHFCSPDRRMRDGGEYAPVGEWQSVPDPGQLEICVYGYHGSRSIANALVFAIDANACLERVELAGWRQSQRDKDCCQRRRALARLSKDDTDLLLNLHAIYCVGWALHRYYAPDNARANLIRLFRLYAVSLRSGVDVCTARRRAREAAHITTEDIAWAAAWTAGRDNASTAASAVACIAAGAAASDAGRGSDGAAWAAAWDAARDATHDALNNVLERRALAWLNRGGQS